MFLGIDLLQMKMNLVKKKKKMYKGHFRVEGEWFFKMDALINFCKAKLIKKIYIYALGHLMLIADI